MGRPGLSHCVGGYARQSAMGKSHIVSVRAVEEDGTWRRLSTIELYRKDGAFHVRQHRSDHNGKPSDEAVRAEHILMHGLASQTLRVDPLAVEEREIVKVESTSYDLEIAFAA